MTVVYFSKPIGAALPLTWRLWALPLVTVSLVLTHLCWFSLDSSMVTMIAAIAIVLAGIPHGTLDVEIAAKHFDTNNALGKAIIIAGYVACALAMILLWSAAPSVALVLFLIISIVHFSRDWRGGVDPFLAMMVGWALVALPALARPIEVAMIFETLTGNQNGSVIAAILACTSVPAALGSLVFAYWSYINDDKQSAVEVIACIVAALFLPPLIAFAVFFCGLHSPRHFTDALAETGGIAPAKKALMIIAVFALSLGLGALLFAGGDSTGFDTGIVHTAFVLISTLTVPHFILEHFMSDQRQTQILAS